LSRGIDAYLRGGLLAVLAIALMWSLMALWIVIVRPGMANVWLFVVPGVLVVVAFAGLLAGDPKAK
jgi:hypothetical protein